ncbi:MAG TPA: response regulator, partial [Longimicrobiales bacterium]|nr:response regulator [Longimicrobiales bacterium]
MAHILVIDDDPPVLRTLARVLEADGHRVRTAPGGREALAAFAEEPAELVVVDIHMPGMDGIEFIREFRKDFP